MRLSRRGMFEKSVPFGLGSASAVTFVTNIWGQFGVDCVKELGTRKKAMKELIAFALVSLATATVGATLFGATALAAMT